MDLATRARSHVGPWRRVNAGHLRWEPRGWDQKKNNAGRVSHLGDCSCTPRLLPLPVDVLLLVCSLPPQQTCKNSRRAPHSQPGCGLFTETHISRQHFYSRASCHARLADAVFMSILNASPFHRAAALL